MKLGLLTRNPNAWCSLQLRKAMETRGFEPICLRFRDLRAAIAMQPEVQTSFGLNVVKEIPCILVRPIGRGTLDEIIFQLDLLHRLERLGTIIVNRPSAIEKAVDKYYALALLEEAGIMVPRTVVCENPKDALHAFDELGGDVVVKPLFGSRGVGITRVTDREVASRIFRSLSFMHNVLYVQEFVAHGTRDIRVFVVGEHVVASMYRVAVGWKTNVSRGAAPVPLSPSREVEELAIKASKVLGCEVAGVDILEGARGFLINEINSQPGFRGLQSTTNLDIAGEIIEYIKSRLR
ncbi:MAG: RimK family alpha-L-glutamate ligase [Candidatus Bathyarchaeia archaeon]